MNPGVGSKCMNVIIVVHKLSVWCVSCMHQVYVHLHRLLICFLMSGKITKANWPSICHASIYPLLLVFCVQGLTPRTDKFFDLNFLLQKKKSVAKLLQQLNILKYLVVHDSGLPVCICMFMCELGVETVDIWLETALMTIERTTELVTTATKLDISPGTAQRPKSRPAVNAAHRSAISMLRVHYLSTWYCILVTCVQNQRYIYKGKT